MELRQNESFTVRAEPSSQSTGDGQRDGSVGNAEMRAAKHPCVREGAKPSSAEPPTPWCAPSGVSSPSVLENHRMVWVGRDLKAHLVPTPLP